MTLHLGILLALLCAVGSNLAFFFKHRGACEAWARERAAPTLLVHTDPARGLISEHAALLQAWANDLSTDPA